MPLKLCRDWFAVCGVLVLLGLISVLGLTLLMVFYRPSAGAKGQVAFTGGYPFASGSTVNMNIGGTVFPKHRSQFCSIKILTKWRDDIGPCGWNGNDSCISVAGKTQEFL